MNDKRATTQLQELCVGFDLAYSGLNKEQLRERLNKFLSGQPVPKRGATRKYVIRKIKEEDQRPPTTPKFSQFIRHGAGAKSFADEFTCSRVAAVCWTWRPVHRRPDVPRWSPDLAHAV